MGKIRAFWLAVLVCGLGICFAVADNLQPGNPQLPGNPTEEELVPPKEASPETPSKPKPPKTPKKKSGKKEEPTPAPTPTPAPAPAPATTPTGEQAPATTVKPKLEFTAAHMEITPEKIVLLVGDVRLAYGATVLTAESVVLYIDSKEAYAEGNIKLQDGKTILYCDRIFYNFDKQGGKAYEAKLYTEAGKPPRQPKGWVFVRPTAHTWVLSAAEITKVEGESKYVASRAMITNCRLAKPHWAVRSSKVTVEPKKKASATNNVLKLGPIPVFYEPYAVKDLKHNWPTVRVKAGSNKEWSTYEETDIRFKINEYFSPTAELDYRKRQGPAGGLDLDYNFGDLGWGKLDTYFMDEQGKGERGRYYAGLDDKDPNSDHNRYKIDLTQRMEFDLAPNSEIDFFKDWKWDLATRYRSDRFFQREYFEDLSKTERDPTSYSNLEKLGFNYDFELYTQARLNDWRTETSYLPEARYNLFSQPLWHSNVYYESYSSLGYLRHEYDEDLKNLQDYDSARLHTQQLVSYPVKFGANVFTFEPYVGAAGSLYDSASVVDDDEISQGAIPYGADLTWRVFRDFDYNGKNVNKLRHVMIGGAEYRGMSEPTELPGEIRQFDPIDAMDRTGQVTPFFRSYLLGKVGEGEKTTTYNIIDFEMRMKFITDEKQAFREWGGRNDGNLETYLSYSPTPKFTLFGGQEYDFHENTSVAYHVGFNVKPTDRVYFQLEDRYYTDKYYGSDETSNEVGGILGANLTEKWGVRLEARYEMEEMPGRDPGFTEERLTFYRLLHDWSMHFTYYHDEYENDHGVFVGIEMLGGGSTHDPR